MSDVVATYPSVVGFCFQSPCLAVLEGASSGWRAASPDAPTSLRLPPVGELFQIIASSMKAPSLQDYDYLGRTM